MNIFKFAAANGDYIVVIPYGHKWLTIEEGYNGTILEYQYIPNLGKKIHAQYTDRGVRYLYGDKRLYMRHCSMKYIPSRFTMGGTI